MQRSEPLQHPQGLNRLEGRLFDDAGHLCLVVEANDATGLGRVSYQEDGARHVIDMPLTEISRLVAQGTNGVSDKSDDLSHRVKEKADGFYAMAREGAIGPFSSFVQAESAMREHIEESLLTNSPAR